MPRPGRFTPGKEKRHPLYRRQGWPQDQSERVREISLPTGIRSSDRPARSASLYRLRYPGQHNKANLNVWSEGVAPLILNFGTSWR